MTGPRNIITLTATETDDLLCGSAACKAEIIESYLERARALFAIIARFTAQHGIGIWTRGWIDVLTCDGEPVARLHRHEI